MFEDRKNRSSLDLVRFPYSSLYLNTIFSSLLPGGTQRRGFFYI